MRILVAKDRKIVPGQEERFLKLVAKNAKELMQMDAWLRENMPIYADEMACNPVLSWLEESEEELYHMAEHFGTGEVFYDDGPHPMYYDEKDNETS